jgi:hypothetical protein
LRQGKVFAVGTDHLIEELLLGEDTEPIDNDEEELKKKNPLAFDHSAVLAKLTPKQMIDEEDGEDILPVESEESAEDEDSHS